MGPWKAVPVKGMGKNIQPEDIKKVKDTHSYVCNICRGSNFKTVGMARYLCMGCRSDPNYKGDYCDVCEQCL